MWHILHITTAYCILAYLNCENFVWHIRQSYIHDKFHLFLRTNTISDRMQWNGAHVIQPNESTIIVPKPFNRVHSTRQRNIFKNSSISLSHTIAINSMVSLFYQIKMRKDKNDDEETVKKRSVLVLQLFEIFVQGVTTGRDLYVRNQNCKFHQNERNQEKYNLSTPLKPGL